MNIHPKRLPRTEIAKAYAAGEISFREVQDRGIFRYTELLALLADLNLRPPIAPDGGPNAESRAEGMRRLEKILTSP